MRQKFDDTADGSSVQTTSGDKVEKNQGAARAISSFIDPGLSWKDLAWFKSITKMPIVLKGVQTWEDAVMAAEQGCQGVVLSNHGCVSHPHFPSMPNHRPALTLVIVFFSCRFGPSQWSSTRRRPIRARSPRRSRP